MSEDDDETHLESIIHSAKRRWLKGYEIYEIITNYTESGLCLRTEVITKPESKFDLIYILIVGRKGLFIQIILLFIYSPRWKLVFI